MKNKLFYSILASVLTVSMFVGFATAQDVSKLNYPKLNKLEIPKIERVTLDNGIRLYIVEDHKLPIFRTSVRINVGSYLEPAGKVGLVSVLTTTLRTGGTTKWTGDEIDELLDGVGARVSVSSGITNCNAFVSTLSENSDLGLDILADILRNPVFDEDKINLSKVGERSGISRRNDETMGIARREFSNVLYGKESPYARHTEYSTIDNVSRDDLLAFHSTFFKPENIQMAIWGDFKKNDMIAKLNKLFGDWERGTTPVPPPPEVEYKYEQQVYHAEKSDINQTSILIGHIGGKITDPDYAARIVMNTIMGVGFGSRMVDNIRSKEGLAYSAFSSFTAGIGRPGIFFNYAATKSETTGKAITEMVKVIKSMQDVPPSADELAQGKDSYLNSFVFKFDTKSEVVNRLMNYDYHGIPEDFLQKVKEQVENVTSEDVVNAANNNLRPDKLRFLVVGKSEDFEVPLASLGFGEVETIDITIPSGEVQRELHITAENLELGNKLLHASAAALGGIDNFKKVNSISSKGTMSLSMQGHQMQLQLERLRVLPDQSRQIVSIMGREMKDIWNKDQGWKTNMMTGKFDPKSEEELLDDKMDNARDQFIIFKQLDDPDFRAVYDGTGKVDGKAVEFVVLLDSEGESICRLAVDASSKELVSRTYWGKSVSGEGNIEQIFSNWTEVDGLKLPMTIVSKMDGTEFGSLAIAEIIINPEVPSGSFDRPE